MKKLALLLLMVVAGWHAAPAGAISPPPMSLPPCVDGQGACPKLNPLVGGSAAGTLTAGGSIVLTTEPAGPVCNNMNGYTYVWTPNACYAGVHKPTIVSCAYIDLRDMKFKEGNCQTVLYRTASQAPVPLFTLKRPAGNTDYNGSTECGAAGNYQTYSLGGPATIPASTWVERGDRARLCELTMGAKRPDGLYGPTWAKVRVGIAYGEDGIGRSGRAETAEFYMPIDGDLRPTAQVEVTATGTLSELDWDKSRVFATYEITVHNFGDEDAKNVNLTATMPSLGIIQSATGGSNCTTPTQRSNAKPDQPITPGGNLVCDWPVLAAHSSQVVHMLARIINATDFAGVQSGEFLQNFNDEPEGMLAKIKSDNDADDRDNFFLAKVEIPFRSGSIEDTKQAMSYFSSYFDYKSEHLSMACNNYKEEAMTRLLRARDEHPEAFSEVSFGPITSGLYLIGGVDTSYTRAGHVGVVVYRKGTNYRQTGIIINGTPSMSPLNQVSQIGGDSHFTTALELATGSTADHGYYLRTPVDKYPGKPQQEANNLQGGFEGRYTDNVAEFTVGNVPTISEGEPIRKTMCAWAPDAVVVGTNSPVEILATNSRGQRVQTQGDKLAVYELDNDIHAMAFPHGDGTYAWTLVLPRDDYKIQLLGTRTGPYELTLTTFDANGQPVQQVTHGETSPGLVEDFIVDAPDVAPHMPWDDEQGKSGGGGAMDAWLLGVVAALGLARVARRRRLTRYC